MTVEGHDGCRLRRLDGKWLGVCGTSFHGSGLDLDSRLLRFLRLGQAHLVLNDLGARSRCRWRGQILERQSLALRMADRRLPDEGAKLAGDGRDRLPVLRDDAICHPGRVAGRTEGGGKIMPYTGLVPRFRFLDVGKQHQQTFARIALQGGLGLFTGLVELPGFECSLRRCSKADRVVGLQRLQPFGTLQPVDGRVAAAGTDIGIGNVRMRLELPDLLQHGTALAQVVFPEIGTRRNDCSRHQGRSQL